MDRIYKYKTMKAAHIRYNKDGTISEQSIKSHCENVAKLASKFAEPFYAEDLAEYTALLHDIGKYSDAFQRRIHGSEERVDHSTFGAQVAWRTGVPAGRIAAFCIGGHHAGLPDLGTNLDTDSDSTMMGKMKRRMADNSDYLNELDINAPVMPENLSISRPEDMYFLVKMLFSSLVDADYLDTEAFMSEAPIDRSIGDDIPFLLSKLNTYIERWHDPVTELNKRRTEILDSVTDHHKDEKGLFSLTVPTGGGKTIASMSFALNHAVSHGMDRIIYVIPYTSIIDQTESIFESVFGKENVLAHHSGVEYENDEDGIADKKHLSTENWDAPIILTTSVQFFESIYANRTSKCRKLHNISNSVVIFDEAQMLPVQLLYPCIAAITNLVKNYGCSAVLCTATQPALNPILEDMAKNLTVTELCPDPLFSDPVFSRVTYENLGKIQDNELLNRLLSNDQVLCVVNSRRLAQSIYMGLPEDTRFHLSTTMIPSHRRKTLEIIRDRLTRGLSCHVVSTSLIEAGVDIDFPVVFRELAGLDSILQAGGRCNREGKRDRKDSTVYIFETEHRKPETMLQNCSATSKVLRRLEGELYSKDTIRAYFEFLFYTLKNKSALDQKGILKKMGSLSFDTISKDFKMIAGSEYVIYISCPENEDLITELRANGPSRPLLRKLGNYSVNVYEKWFRLFMEAGKLEPLSDRAGILLDPLIYDPKIGIVIDDNSES